MTNHTEQSAINKIIQYSKDNDIPHDLGNADIVNIVHVIHDKHITNERRMKTVMFAERYGSSAEDIKCIINSSGKSYKGKNK